MPGKDLRGLLGVLSRDFNTLFAKKSALMGRIFGEMAGGFLRCRLRRNPPEREKNGAGSGG